MEIWLCLCGPRLELKIILLIKMGERIFNIGYKHIQLKTVEDKIFFAPLSIF